MKSVITAAGKGIRLLPATKETPKEMMPIFTKISTHERVVTPLLQFIFEQLFSLKIRDYCFVVGRGKRSIEDHFTPHHSYLNELTGKYKILLANFYKKLENSHLIWINQNKPEGFGDAVKRAERYIGTDNFIVHGGDVAILSRTKHPIVRLAETAAKNSSVSAVLFCKKVKNPRRYGVPKITKITNSLFTVTEIEEKPIKPKSNLAILPLYYFKPEIFDCLKKIKRGKGNEFQLTDAIQKLIDQGNQVIAIPMLEQELEIDVGTVESYRHALEISYKKA